MITQRYDGNAAKVNTTLGEKKKKKRGIKGGSENSPTRLHSRLNTLHQVLQKKLHNFQGANSKTMKKTIQAFLDDKKLGIVGASPNKDNFGRSLMIELIKKDYQPIPVNPKYDKVEGIATLPTVKELPEEVENLILATPAHLTGEIVNQCIGTHIKRVWMIRGVGKGAYTEEAHLKCKENGIEVVYGFCPMMFLGEGLHKFHFWLRQRFGKMPGEYMVSEN